MDTLVDFSHAQGDTFDLSAIDANTATAGNQAFTFIGEAAFTVPTHIFADREKRSAIVKLEVTRITCVDAHESGLIRQRGGESVFVGVNDTVCA